MKSYGQNYLSAGVQPTKNPQHEGAGLGAGRGLPEGKQEILLYKCVPETQSVELPQTVLMVLSGQRVKVPSRMALLI